WRGLLAGAGVGHVLRRHRAVGADFRGAGLWRRAFRARLADHLDGPVGVAFHDAVFCPAGVGRQADVRSVWNIAADLGLVGGLLDAAHARRAARCSDVVAARFL